VGNIVSMVAGRSNAMRRIFLVTCVNEFLVEDADCGEDTCTNASCQ
jgi:hypothetical protein